MDAGSKRHAPATGALLWTASADGISTTPAADDSGVYMALDCGPVYAYAPDTGALRWTTTVPCYGGNDTVTMLYRGLVYSSGSVPAGILDERTGTQIGSYSDDFFPAFIGDDMIGYTHWQQFGDRLALMTVADQSVLWTISPQPIGYLFGLVLPIGAVLAAPESADGMFGRVVVLDRATGVELGFDDVSSFFVPVPGMEGDGISAQTEADGVYIVAVGATLRAY